SPYLISFSLSLSLSLSLSNPININPLADFFLPCTCLPPSSSFLSTFCPPSPYLISFSLSLSLSLSLS
ncbi:MAG: hypothetical protein K7J15_06510, partial [Candidatus Regiella insecticola]|nr:hypothetical protein [Candidatus Regiella insecticola]